MSLSSPAPDGGSGRLPGEDADGGAGPTSLEDLNSSNRWAELENTAIALAMERDALRGEVLQLRRTNEAMAAASDSAKVAAVDNEELKTLRKSLDEAQKEADANLRNVVAERSRAASMSEELQSKAAEISSLIASNKDLRTKALAAEADLLPIRAEVQQLEQVRASAEVRAADVQSKMDTLIAEHNKAVHEKADQARAMAEEVKSARAEAGRGQMALEEAQGMLKAAQQQATEAEQRFQDSAKRFSDERASLEQQLHLRGEQLGHETKACEDAKQQLAQVSSDRTATAKALEAARQENEDLRGQVGKLEQNLDQMKVEQRALMKKHMPEPAVSGASLPDEFPSIAELVRQVTAARAEALQERQARQKAEGSLRSLELDIRARLPALASQREEVERLRSTAERLTKQNEELLAQAKDLQEAQETAQARAAAAERSEHILEKHARSIAQQLGLVLEENTKLRGPAQPPASDEAASAPQASAPPALMSAKDLAEHNESLRKSVARLTEECETAAQRELQAMREEHDQQAKKWKQELEDKDSQLSALATKIDRLANACSEDKSTVPASSAGTTSASGSSTAAHSKGGVEAAGAASRREVVLREQLQDVRVEFAKCVEVLQKEVCELRAGELSARRELVSVRGTLDFELSRRSKAEGQLGRALSKLEEQREQLKFLERRSEALRDDRRGDESSSRSLEALLGQAQRDRAHLEVQLRLERSKVAAVEKHNAKLLEAQVTHKQLAVDLEARLAQETDSYKNTAHGLDTAYKREEKLLREQLDLSSRRQEDFRRSVAELGDALKAREAEVSAARARAAELEASSARIEADLAQRTAEVRELRAAGVARPRRGVELAAEAAAQLKRARVRRRGSSGVAATATSAPSAAGAEGADALPPEPPAGGLGLEHELRLTKERERTQARTVERLQSLVASNEKELKERQEEVFELMQTSETRKAEAEALSGKVEQSRRHEQELEARVNELQAEISALQATIQKKDAEAAAVLAEQERARSAKAAEQDSEDAQDGVLEWQRRHRQAVQDHGQCIAELEMARENISVLQRKISDLQQRPQEPEKEREDEGVQPGEPQVPRHDQQRADQQARAMQASAMESEDLPASTEHAGAIAPQKLRELQVDRSRVERECIDLRAAVADLKLRLRAEAGREQLVATKLGSYALLEDENRRLVAEIESTAKQLKDTEKQAMAHKSELEPLSREVGILRRREKMWSSEKTDLESKIEREKKRSLGGEEPAEEAKELDAARVAIEQLTTKNKHLESVKQLHHKRMEEMKRQISELEAERKTDDDKAKRQRSAATGDPSSGAAAANLPAGG